jgi:hypothetical protein
MPKETITKSSEGELV